MAKRGETREVILKAATKLFFENGYEATSVKMLISEAGIVIGSFYHFFESKEALFEGVVERFIDEYTAGISKLLQDESLSFYDMIDRYVKEYVKADKSYYEMFHGDKLHWSLQYALHDRILDTVMKQFTDMLITKMNRGELVSFDNMSEKTLAALIIKGIDTILSETNDRSQIIKYCEKYISVNADAKEIVPRKLPAGAEIQNTNEATETIEVNESVKDKNNKASKKTDKKGVKENKNETINNVKKEDIVENKKQDTKEAKKEKSKDNVKDSIKTNNKLTDKENIKITKVKPIKKTKKIEEETYVQMSIFEFE